MSGGGDGGFGARQDAQDAEKQRARDKLNILFGVAPSGADASGINRDAYYKPGGLVWVDRGDSGGYEAEAPIFDQAAYDAAVAAANATNDEALKNKGDLESLFGTVRTNAFDAGKRRLDESKGQAARDLRFELFARGLNAGSVDVDQNALLGRTYSQGIADLGGKADTLQSQFKGDNEAARLQLLQSIDSGMDAGSAVSSALGQMRVNADRAAADAIGTNVGDLFSTAGLIYNQNRVAQGRQNAGNWWATQNTGGGNRGSSGARSGSLSFAG
jgi:hypothetical protein